MDVGWPAAPEELVELQMALAAAADRAAATDAWLLPAATDELVVGGCFIAYASGEAGPGHPGDRAWAAASTWQPGPKAPSTTTPPRKSDRMLVGTGSGGPRQPADVIEQVVVAGRAPAAYLPGLLALREGPLLHAAAARLRRPPSALLVDATGRDHPRRAGLAIHLGAALAIPTVGVTHRPLRAEGELPPLARGATSALVLGDEEVARWVCTRPGARPVAAHAGWRTDPATAAALVLAASTPASRTPVPLGEARRVARETRAIAEGRAPTPPSSSRPR